MAFKAVSKDGILVEGVIFLSSKIVIFLSKERLLPLSQFPSER
jgi:hypothetical protein